MSISIPENLSDWLAESANGIDLGTVPASEILPRLAEAGLTRIGVPVELGGAGGDLPDAVAAIAAVARQSMAAAFILWGHRSYTEFLLQSDNAALRERQLPDLLAGRIAGASGLSNVMKSLAGLEPLQISARSEGSELVVDGKLPWVTNLRSAGFHVAAAADPAEGGPAMILSLSHDDAGLQRSDDLDLIAMRSSDTAALSFSGLHIPRDRILAHDAQQWLAAIRPSFLTLQCGMSIGLAARALDEAEATAGRGREVLEDDIQSVRDEHRKVVTTITNGLRSNVFAAHPEALFELRIQLADIVTNAVALELQAGGGRCYLREKGSDFARRWREAAFVPVVTPSVVQLRGALAQAQRAA